MPPGNINNKASVRNKCTYCGKSSCKGESNHFNPTYDPIYNQFHASVTYATERNFVQQTRPSVNHDSVNPRQIFAESSQSIRSPTGVRNALPQVSPIAEAKVSVDSGSFDQTNQKSVLEGVSNLSTTASVHSNKETINLKGTLNPSSTAGSTSSPQSNKKTVVLPDNVNLFGSAGIKNAFPEKKGDGIDSVQSLQKEIKSNNKPNENIDNDKACFNHSDPVKLNKSGLHQITAQFSNVDKDVQERKTFNKSVNDCSLGYSECQSSLNDEINLKLTQKKHSDKAAIYEGIVVKILDARTAKLRVGNADVEPKFVQLFVDNLLPSRNESAYTLNTDIKSVLSIGEIITLICTEHNKKNTGFQLFAHEAWKTEKRNIQSNNNDAQSVASYASHGSVPGSESSKCSRSRKRNKNEMAECNSNDLSEAIYQWLDRNESSHSNKNASKSAVLVEGCDYTGTVIELRLPYAFIVEVSLNRDVEHIYGLARNFYPGGPNSPSAALGISIRDLMNVRDEVIVVPYRSAQPKESSFVWVAKMAWPIIRNIRSNQSDVGMQKKSEQLSEKFEDVVQQDGAVTSSSNCKNNLDGEILSLQSSWGLVKEVGKGSAYVFTRKNAFLFGLNLKTFVLEDIFQEGQSVKFSLEDGESGLMHAKLVWCGNSSPNYNSLCKALLRYCRARKIKSYIEISLVKLGEVFYNH